MTNADFSMSNSLHLAYRLTIPPWQHPRFDQGSGVSAAIRPTSPILRFRTIHSVVHNRILTRPLSS